MISLKPMPLSRTTVTTSAVNHLRDQIVAGALQPGDGLPEARVGELLGVSRAPVREALTLLEREGLVTFDRRGTARVSEFAFQDVRELSLMRQALEPPAARLTCQRLTPALVSNLEQNLAQLHSAKSLPEITTLDVDFHRLLVSASGNRRLHVAWEQLAAQFKVVMGQFHRAIEARTQATRDMTYQGHVQLLKAIQKDDPDENEALALRHAMSWLQGWHAAPTANRTGGKCG